MNPTSNPDLEPITAPLAATQPASWSRMVLAERLASVVLQSLDGMGSAADGERILAPLRSALRVASPEGGGPVMPSAVWVELLRYAVGLEHPALREAPMKLAGTHASADAQRLALANSDLRTRVANAQAL